MLYRLRPLEGYLRAVSRLFFLWRRLGLGRYAPETEYVYYLPELVGRGDVAIDIGANLGYYSRPLSKLVGERGHVYSVEPMPPVLEVLRHNLRRSRNVTILPYALGEQDGEITMANDSARETGYLGTGQNFVNESGGSADVEYRAEMRRGSELFADLKRLDFIKCDIETTVLEDGSKLYNCILSYSLTVAEVATSTTVATEKFDSKSGIFTGSITSASSPEQAIANEVGRIEKAMERFVVNNFPIEGILVPSDYEVKKDKLVTCYIDLGSEQGVKVGDLFIVKAPKVVLGNVTYNEIGRLKVSEVVAGSISQCKVTTGPKEIFMAIENYLALDEASQKTQPVKVQAMVREDVGGVLNKIGL